MTRASPNQSIQSFPFIFLSQTGGQRVGTGAGATPLFVAAIRHDTFLARIRSLKGRSRTWPTAFIANPNAIPILDELI
jgi:hypothetical protein